MLSADLLRMEGADALSSAHEHSYVFVLLFGCFGGCWVQSKPPIMWGLQVLYLGGEVCTVLTPR